MDAPEDPPTAAGDGGPRGAVPGRNCGGSLEFPGLLSATAASSSAGVDRPGKYATGTRILKRFAGFGKFEGVVASFDGVHYRINYLDGDRGDMSEGEFDMSDVEVIAANEEDDETKEAAPALAKEESIGTPKPNTGTRWSPSNRSPVFRKIHASCASDADSSKHKTRGSRPLKKRTYIETRPSWEGEGRARPVKKRGKRKQQNPEERIAHAADSQEEELPDAKPSGRREGTRPMKKRARWKQEPPEETAAHKETGTDEGDQDSDRKTASTEEVEEPVKPSEVDGKDEKHKGKILDANPIVLGTNTEQGSDEAKKCLATTEGDKNPDNEVVDTDPSAEAVGTSLAQRNEKRKLQDLEEKTTPADEQSGPNDQAEDAGTSGVAKKQKPEEFFDTQPSGEGVELTAVRMGNSGPTQTESATKPSGEKAGAIQASNDEPGTNNGECDHHADSEHTDGNRKLAEKLQEECSMPEPSANSQSGEIAGIGVGVDNSNGAVDATKPLQPKKKGKKGSRLLKQLAAHNEIGGRLDIVAGTGRRRTRNREAQGTRDTNAESTAADQGKDTKPAAEAKQEKGKKRGRLPRKSANLTEEKTDERDVNDIQNERDATNETSGKKSSSSAQSKAAKSARGKVKKGAKIAAAKTKIGEGVKKVAASRVISTDKGKGTEPTRVTETKRRRGRGTSSTQESTLQSAIISKGETGAGEEKTIMHPEMLSESETGHEEGASHRAKGEDIKPKEGKRKKAKGSRLLRELADYNSVPVKRRGSRTRVTLTAALTSPQDTTNNDTMPTATTEGFASPPAPRDNKPVAALTAATDTTPAEAINVDERFAAAENSSSGDQNDQADAINKNTKPATEEAVVAQPTSNDDTFPAAEAEASSNIKPSKKGTISQAEAEAVAPANEKTTPGVREACIDGGAESAEAHVNKDLMPDADASTPVEAEASSTTEPLLESQASRTEGRQGISDKNAMPVAEEASSNRGSVKPEAEATSPSTSDPVPSSTNKVHPLPSGKIAKCIAETPDPSDMDSEPVAAKASITEDKTEPSGMDAAKASITEDKTEPSGMDAEPAAAAKTPTEDQPSPGNKEVMVVAVDPVRGKPPKEGQQGPGDKDAEQATAMASCTLDPPETSDKNAMPTAVEIPDPSDMEAKPAAMALSTVAQGESSDLGAKAAAAKPSFEDQPGPSKSDFRAAAESPKEDQPDPNDKDLITVAAEPTGLVPTSSAKQPLNTSDNDVTSMAVEPITAEAPNEDQPTPNDKDAVEVLSDPVEAIASQEGKACPSHNDVALATTEPSELKLASPEAPNEHQRDPVDYDILAISAVAAASAVVTLSAEAQAGTSNITFGAKHLGAAETPGKDQEVEDDKDVAAMAEESVEIRAHNEDTRDRPNELRAANESNNKDKNAKPKAAANTTKEREDGKPAEMSTNYAQLNPKASTKEAPVDRCDADAKPAKFGAPKKPSSNEKTGKEELGHVTPDESTAAKTTRKPKYPVGALFFKKFNSDRYAGLITSFDGDLYKVRYPKDGDEEELSDGDFDGSDIEFLTMKEGDALEDTDDTKSETDSHSASKGRHCLSDSSNEDEMSEEENEIYYRIITVSNSDPLPGRKRKRPLRQSPPSSIKAARNTSTPNATSCKIPRRKPTTTPVKSNTTITSQWATPPGIDVCDSFTIPRRKSTSTQAKANTTSTSLSRWATPPGIDPCGSFTIPKKSAAAIKSPDASPRLDRKDSGEQQRKMEEGRTLYKNHKTPMKRQVKDPRFAGRQDPRFPRQDPRFPR